MSEPWWSPAMNILADQLSKGVLNEMKKRILKSNIRKQRLTLDEDSKRMREFFEREIQRHNKKRANLKHKQRTLQSITKQLQEVQQALSKKDKELSEKEQLYTNQRKLNVEYKKIIKKQMMMLDHLKNQRHGRNTKKW